MQLFSIPEDNSTMDSMHQHLQANNSQGTKPERKGQLVQIKEKPMSRMVAQKSEPLLKQAKSPPASQYSKVPRFQQPTQSYNMKKKPAYTNP